MHGLGLTCCDTRLQDVVPFTVCALTKQTVLLKTQHNVFYVVLYKSRLFKHNTNFDLLAE